jgi:hypothetical protein
MKKSTLLTALIGLSFAGMAQNKPAAHPIKKDTAKYEKLIKLPISDYSALIQLADAYKQSVIYNPKIQDADKVKEQQNIDMYLFNLPKRIVLDSVKIKK